MNGLKLDVKNGGGSVYSIHLFETGKTSEFVLNIISMQNVLLKVFTTYYQHWFFTDSCEEERGEIIILHELMSGILCELLECKVKKSRHVSIITITEEFLETVTEPLGFIKTSERMQSIFEHFLIDLDGDTITDMPTSKILDVKNFFKDIFFRCFEIQFNATKPK